MNAPCEVVIHLVNHQAQHLRSTIRQDRFERVELIHLSQSTAVHDLIWVHAFVLPEGLPQRFFLVGPVDGVVELAWLENFELYGDMSSRMMSIVGRYAPRQEVYSIDESFLDFDGVQSDLTSLGREMRGAVQQWIGPPTCVGFGPTKTLAKLGNHSNRIELYLPAALAGTGKAGERGRSTRRHSKSSLPAQAMGATPIILAARLQGSIPTLKMPTPRCWWRNAWVTRFGE